MPTLELKDGRKIEIKGNPTQEQIDSLLDDLSKDNSSPQSQSQPQPQQSNLGKAVDIAFTPLAKTLTGQSLSDRMMNKVGMANVTNDADLYGNNPVANAMTIANNTAMGTAADFAESFTSPAVLLGGLLSKVPGVQQAGQSIAESPVGKAVGQFLTKERSVNNILKYDSALKQAEKSKTALDSLRTNLGKAKELALSNTGDIPVDVNFSGNVSSKVINAIKNPVYGVEFTPEGGVVGNIKNLDKIKTAMNDLVTTKDFVEAGNMEKRQILQFAGRLRDDMVRAANDAGRPELGKSLRDYHNFMENYNKINDHLTDKYGDAMANKLKSTFGLFAEPAVKQAWKEVAKTSPELKAVMGSMNRRELLKNLLKVGGAGAALMTGANVVHAGENIDISKINQIESSGNPKAIGDKGKAFGLNQIHLSTLSDYNKSNKTNYTKDDLLKGDINNKVADWYFNKEIPRLLKHYKLEDNPKNRIIAYNFGVGNLKSGKPIPETTKRYLKKYGL